MQSSLRRTIIPRLKRLKRGFIYHFQKATLSDEVFICINQKRTKGNCNARIRKDTEAGEFRKDGHHAHNHPPELDQQRHVAFVNACAVEACISSDPPREIFDRIRRGYPGLLLTYKDAMQRRIQRAKRSMQPRIPKTIDEAY
ncbi:hypothetical protein DAPPUDRAFT_334013 [Daphnia pulex]|uniref:FLYWCH-type domain-containing protein n=1 Tax=Daphnia pulex TaxID=6669 RepID=E9HUG7_DAPPU|nr:hypothetical protein DAPPUDRAFT_334013 [Daphnia pulex]|eukprot:EFX64622.1 hypothetical protein DAPPUDRAFT_334013 [Daphnia pulex]